MRRRQGSGPRSPGHRPSGRPGRPACGSWRTASRGRRPARPGGPRRPMQARPGGVRSASRAASCCWSCRPRSERRSRPRRPGRRRAPTSPNPRPPKHTTPRVPRPGARTTPPGPGSHGFVAPARTARWRPRRRAPGRSRDVPGDAGGVRHTRPSTGTARHRSLPAGPVTEAAGRSGRSVRRPRVPPPTDQPVLRREVAGSHGSTRSTVPTRSIDRSNDATAATPEASARATR